MLKFVDAVYLKLIKPILFAMSPDKAHSLIMSVMAWAGGVGFLRFLASKMFGKKYPQLKTNFKGLDFDSPVGLSAGLDKNGQIVPIISCLGFGFSEVGSVTAEKCEGNARPWFHRLPADKSLMVHAGLANVGVVSVLKNIQKNSKFYFSEFEKFCLATMLRTFLMSERLQKNSVSLSVNGQNLSSLSKLKK